MYTKFLQYFYESCNFLQQQWRSNGKIPLFMSCLMSVRQMKGTSLKVESCGTKRVSTCLSQESEIKYGSKNCGIKEFFML